MFRDRAVQSGLYKGSPEPLPHIHSRYYDKYVRNTQNSALNSRGPSGERQLNENAIAAERTRHFRNRSTLQTTHQKKLEAYIPLRDLMKHNHEERVQSYLKKLNEEEAERLRNLQQQNMSLGANTKPRIQVEDAEKAGRGKS